MSKKPLAVFLRPMSYPVPRVLRNMKAAREVGFDVVFIGAAREPNLPREEEWEGVPVRRVGPHYQDGARGYFQGTPIWVLSGWRALRKLRPGVIHASDAEAMFSVALYRLFRRRGHVIYNIHDNLSVRHAWPGWFRAFLNGFERTVGRRADIVMVPDKARLRLLKPWVPRRSLIIPNTLPDPGYAPAKPTERLRIFYGGWLNWTRGLKTLGRVVSSRGDVDLVVCGMGPREVQDYVRALPHTKFLGYLPQSEELREAQECDLVIAQYDPRIEINRFASPNKLFTAMALGRPIIVNKELAIAGWVVNEGIGYTVPYGDAKALDALVGHLRSSPEELDKIGKRGRSLYEEEYGWERVEEQVREAFREGLRLVAEK